MFGKINEICNELKKHYEILNKPIRVAIGDNLTKDYPNTISNDGNYIGGISIKVGNDNVAINHMAFFPEYRSRDHKHSRNVVALLVCNPKMHKITIIYPVDSAARFWGDLGFDLNVGNPEQTREEFFKNNIKDI